MAAFTLRIIEVAFAFWLASVPLFAAKIKDVANVVGVRDNQLIGYGLVVGLAGTGDGSTSVFTTQSLANLLATVNVKIDAAAIKSKNIAAVMVTANIPPFSRQGDKMDVSISSIGDAKSLEGGTLLLTPLKGVDGRIYALSQGVVSTGGFNAGGAKGQKNHTTSATLRNGAIVEREIAYNLRDKETASISLKIANLQNAVSMQNAINKAFGAQLASAVDSKTVKIERPANASMVEFLAKVEELSIDVNKQSRIVIDEKTGTIVAGADVKIDPIVVTHGDITIKIRAQDQKAEASKTDVDAGDGVLIGTQTGVVSAPEGQMSIASLMRALQKLGAKPRDIISVIETMKNAGALNAELEII